MATSKPLCVIYDDRIAAIVVGTTLERAMRRLRVVVAAALVDSNDWTPPIGDDFYEQFESRLKVIELHSFMIGDVDGDQRIFSGEAPPEAENVEEVYMWALPYRAPEPI